jgi:hypothetical protein
VIAWSGPAVVIGGLLMVPGGLVQQSSQENSFLQEVLFIPSKKQKK